MPTLEEIEGKVMELTNAQQEALLDWLVNLVEDRLEFTDEFKAKIKQGEREIAEGHVRLRKTDTAS